MSLPSYATAFTAEPLPQTMIFFGLDNTLFDHTYSLYNAMFAVQRIFNLYKYPLKDLVHAYDKALNHVYNRYLQNEIKYEDQAAEKIKLFAKAFGLRHDPQSIKEFREIYREAYQENRRAMPGSIEALTKLREDGYRTAIITNGPTEQQIEKAKAIGVYDLVEQVITSEEACHPKPDYRIFQYAMEKLEVSPEYAYMVGDSVDCDIDGAIEAGITPILYDPCSERSSQVSFGEQVTVIRSFGELHRSLILSDSNLSQPLSAYIHQHADFQSFSQAIENFCQAVEKTIDPELVLGL
ncbi:had-superfamily protein [Fusarium beomiforme]|uniref:Had-superfamily protein n=1 Tax=Fusarium beomiforme TaxID=44412 RepID=A0A9P5E2U0_9HYPO|nr:had-superfamily protein [Fusarium beomiforme]